MMPMQGEPDHNLGEQPIAQFMAELNLKPHDLVAASTEQIAHKMVTKACKGRRLTPHVQAKIVRALNKVSGRSFAVEALFNY